MIKNKSYKLIILAITTSCLFSIYLKQFFPIYLILLLSTLYFLSPKYFSLIKIKFDFIILLFQKCSTFSILTISYIFIIIPVGITFKAYLYLKKENNYLSDTNFIERNHEYSISDILNPY